MTEREAKYAEGRRPGYTYLSDPFTLQFESSRDLGHQARYATRVFDMHEDHDEAPGWDWTEMEVHRSPKGRVQVKAMVAREAGAIRRIKIEKVHSRKNATSMDPVVTLDRETSHRFIEFVKALEHVPVDGEGGRVCLDEPMMRELSRDPSAMADLYARDPERFRTLITNDETADDLVALARRREVLQTFRSWLEDADAFQSASCDAGGPERAWQRLFEDNPWILGVGLGGQLLTSWDERRLEQTVAGQTNEHSGKRIDALLKTQGSVSSMVLAEIKHHQCDLLQSKSYRPGCWGPSGELTGGIVQAQQTVYRASDDLSEYVRDRAHDGSDLPTGTFVVRPRSYLVVGSLSELIGEAGGVHHDKFRSFELHRRNLYEPVVLTFDEVLARAEWQVSRLHRDSRGEHPEVPELVD